MIVRILFFDTKTTGLPRNYKKAEEDLDNYPHCLELGAKIIELDLNDINIKENVIVQDIFSLSTLIKPTRKNELITINPIAEKKHGISIEECEEDGNPIDTIAYIFQGLMTSVDFIVCHNYNLQRNIMVSELLRLGIKPISRKGCKQFCTMLYTTEILKFPPRNPERNPGTFRYPLLDELYKYLKDNDISNIYEHDNALNNVLATEDCLLELLSTDKKVLSWFKGEIQVIY